MSKKWVLPIALVVLLLPIGISVWQVLSFTHGILSYPFDDVFIHMAIAKNIAFHGVWGISPHAFSSASSSVLYPLLLAGCFKIFGVWTGFPLLINLTAGIAVILAVQSWLNSQGLEAEAQTTILVLMVLLTPLPALVCFGMEHTLQLLFDFLFIYRMGDVLCKEERPSTISPSIYIYGILVVAIRYEGLFIISIACLLLLIANPSIRGLILTAKLGIVSSLPVLLFGSVSIAEGSFFIPNSVLVKSVAPSLTPTGIFQFLTNDLFTHPLFFHQTIGGLAIQRLLLLLPVTYLLFLAKQQERIREKMILLLLMGITYLHLLFASTSILFRYEAYLLGCSIPIIAMIMKKANISPLYRRPWEAYISLFLLIIFTIPIIVRSARAFTITTRGSINIFEQQYQMGRFVNQYYKHTPIAMGDIGAISFFSDGKNLDLEGLGDVEVARSRKFKYWSPGFLDMLCKKDRVQVAIVFDKSYWPELRNHWKKVATWKIPNNVACYSDSVSFYAVDSIESPFLQQHLNAFQASLPQDVIVHYVNP